MVVGRVGRPHGLDGSFYVVDATPELPATDGVVSGRRIVRRAGTAEKPILRLEGSTSREDAEALRGLELRRDGFEHVVELGAALARRGHRIAEIPIEYTPRQRGRSKMRHLPEMGKFLALVLAYRLGFGARAGGRRGDS